MTSFGSYGFIVAVYHSLDKRSIGLAWNHPNCQPGNVLTANRDVVASACITCKTCSPAIFFFGGTLRQVGPSQGAQKTATTIANNAASRRSRSAKLRVLRITPQMK